MKISSSRVKTTAAATQMFGSSCHCLYKSTASPFFFFCGFSKQLLPSFIHSLPLCLPKEWTAYRIRCKLYDQLKVFVLDAREMYVECFSEVKCAQSCSWATLDVRPVSKVAEIWLVFHARRCVTMLFCSFHTDALFFLSYLWRGAIYVVLHFS